MKATGQMVSVPGYIPALRNAIETLERGQKLEIKAECHSDDLAYEIDFDALPWFEQANDHHIVRLCKCGWGGNEPADEVAEFMEKENDKVADMFKYIRHLPESKACGFECHVDEWDALAWVLVNRPHLVTLAQAL